ncbi:ankyrin repeat-containing domain protein [Baffinella frigidus]|nr:ankyrin repeat-containing domain protein [Cryptophyta sp. CCMP2293]
MTQYNELLWSLERCLMFGKTAEALRLLDDGPIQHVWGMEKLSLICAYGYADLTQIFVDRVIDLDLNPSNDNKMSCLMHAVVGRMVRMDDMAPCDYPAVVRILLLAGADPNWCNRGGRTALHAAALCGEHETVSTLLEDERVSTQINTKDTRGSTPLFLVCTNSQVSKEEGNSLNLDTVKVLLRNKADPSITCGEAAMTSLVASIHHGAYWRIIDDHRERYPSRESVSNGTGKSLQARWFFRHRNHQGYDEKRIWKSRLRCHFHRNRSDSKTGVY